MGPVSTRYRLKLSKLGQKVAPMREPPLYNVGAR
jgi:hypothetical protein